MAQAPRVARNAWRERHSIGAVPASEAEPARTTPLWYCTCEGALDFAGVGVDVKGGVGASIIAVVLYEGALDFVGAGADVGYGTGASSTTIVLCEGALNSAGVGVDVI